MSVHQPDDPLGKRARIPQRLRDVYAEVAAKAHELRKAEKDLAEIVVELNRLGFRTRTGLPWRHATQISKLMKSFSKGGE